MPKCGRKSGGREGGDKGQMNTSNDVTVYDFAHSEASPKRTTYRMKKGATNAIKSEVKQLIGCPTRDTPALAWYEKDLDDFDVLENSNEDELDEEGEETSDGELVIKTVAKKVKTTPNIENGTISYPLDLWFLISEFVEPEDVGRFACICTSSHYVTHTAQFWRRLYDRHYNKSLDLPPQLQKTSMERLHGLRGRVIRALQVMHTPYIERYKQRGQPFVDDLYFLEGYICTVMWYQKYKHFWNFCFKFKQDSTPCSLRRLAQLTKNNQNTGSPRRGQKQHDLINGFNDIHDNHEDGCFVMKVSCKNFSSFPVIMGMVLNKVYLNVSQNMQFHRLRLVFDTHRVKDIKQCNTGITVVLDPVLNAKVLKWWDPHFPTPE